MLVEVVVVVGGDLEVGDSLSFGEPEVGLQKNQMVSLIFFFCINCVIEVKQRIMQMNDIK